MTTQSPFEGSMQDLEFLLLFLREIKLSYKELAKHCGVYSEKCMATMEKAKVLACPEQQKLQATLLSYISAMASASATQSTHFTSLHSGLKSLVAVVKETQRELEQGAKACSDRLKNARKAWEKVEGPKAVEQKMSQGRDLQSHGRSLGAETTEEKNYSAVERDCRNRIVEYIKRVQELKGNAMMTVSQALTELLSRKQQSTPHVRTPLLMLKGQNSFSSCEPWGESVPPKFGDISSISKASLSSVTSQRREGNLRKLHEFLLTSESHDPLSPST